MGLLLDLKSQRNLNWRLHAPPRDGVGFALRVASGRGRRRGRRQSRRRRGEDGAARGRLADGGAVVARRRDVGRRSRRRRGRADRRARAARREPLALRTLKLERGRVVLDVDPLAPGAVLAVQTNDSRVTVHGTRFLVEATPGGTVGGGRSRPRRRRRRARRSTSPPGSRSCRARRSRSRWRPITQRASPRSTGRSPPGRPRASTSSPTSPMPPSPSTASSTGARRCRWR